MIAYHRDAFKGLKGRQWILFCSIVVKREEVSGIGFGRDKSVFSYHQFHSLVRKEPLQVHPESRF